VQLHIAAFFFTLTQFVILYLTLQYGQIDRQAPFRLILWLAAIGMFNISRPAALLRKAKQRGLHSIATLAHKISHIPDITLREIPRADAEFPTHERREILRLKGDLPVSAHEAFRRLIRKSFYCRSSSVSTI